MLRLVKGTGRLIVRVAGFVVVVLVEKLVVRRAPEHYA